MGTYGPAYDEKLDIETVAAARADLLARRAEGCICPVCDKWAMEYRRKFSGGMARALIAIYRRGGEGARGWSSTNGLHAISGDYAKSRLWGLSEQEEREPGGPHTGRMRVTPLGVEFVERRCAILSHAVEYDGTMIDLVGDWVRIVDVLPVRFNWYELMRRSYYRVTAPQTGEPTQEEFGI